MTSLGVLLERTSRTFALSVPLLPEPLRREVTLAYLLFRIADTLEDEGDWPATRRVAALERLGALLREDRPEGSRRSAVLAELRDAPTAHAGYAELMRSAGAVLDELAALDTGSRAVIRSHACRSVAGMRRFLAMPRGLASVYDVRAYCYAVAGLVGELCTRLFVARCPALLAGEPRLVRLAAAFGEGLQLVNILKDEHDDARGGRCFVPSARQRARLVRLAGSDLRRAVAYVGLLERHAGPPGVVAFNFLNLRLAIAALPLVHQLGPGARIDRHHAMLAYAQAREVAEGRRHALPLLEHAVAPLRPVPAGRTAARARQPADTAPAAAH